MILLTGHTKGGVGKSTLAIQIAVASARAGRRVWVIDGDPQKTTATALQVRADASVDPFIAVSSLSDGRELRTQVLGQRGQFDDIVIDAGGKDSTALRAALMVADVLLVPFRPRAFDVWAFDDICALIDQANATRDGLRACAVLNMADVQGRDNADAVSAAAQYTQLEFLPSRIVNRKALAEASSQGLSVLDGRDRKSAAEMQALFDAIFIES